MIEIDGCGYVPNDHERGNAEKGAGEIPDPSDGQHHEPFGRELKRVLFQIAAGWRAHLQQRPDRHGGDSQALSCTHFNEPNRSKGL